MIDDIYNNLTATTIEYTESSLLYGTHCELHIECSYPVKEGENEHELLDNIMAYRGYKDYKKYSPMITSASICIDGHINQPVSIDVNMIIYIEQKDIDAFIGFFERKASLGTIMTALML